MAALTTLFACNLWGFFEVRLPQTIFDFSVRAGNTNGLGGHFLQGAFATLLATPCSAPFLGTAVGFALAGGTAHPTRIDVFFPEEVVEQQACAWNHVATGFTE